MRNVLSAILWLGSAGASLAQSASVSLTKTDAPDPVNAGGTLTYTITVSNEGPDVAASVLLSDVLPVGETFAGLPTPAGWNCTTPSVGANGTVSCSIASLPTGSVVFTLTVTVDGGLANGTVLSNTAGVSSATSDPNGADNVATADTTVASSGVLIAITKADAPDPVIAGSPLTYTITASNGSGADLESATVSDTLPAGTTFVSLSAPSGWSCSPLPAVGFGGTVSCTTAPFVQGDAVFTLVVQVDAETPAGTVLANAARLDATDNGRTASFEGDASTVVARVSIASVPTLTSSLAALLALALGAIGWLAARRG